MVANVKITRMLNGVNMSLVNGYWVSSLSDKCTYRKRMGWCVLVASSDSPFAEHGREHERNFIGPLGWRP